MSLPGQDSQPMKQQAQLQVCLFNLHIMRQQMGRQNTVTEWQQAFPEFNLNFFMDATSICHCHSQNKCKLRRILN
jgi:hypothetical protein